MPKNLNKCRKFWFYVDKVGSGDDEHGISPDNGVDCVVRLYSVQGVGDASHEVPQIYFHPIYKDGGKVYCLTLVEREWKDRAVFAFDTATGTVSLDGHPFMTCLFKDASFSMLEEQGAIVIRGTLEPDVAFTGALRYMGGRHPEPGKYWELGWKEFSAKALHEVEKPDLHRMAIPRCVRASDAIPAASLEWTSLDLGGGKSLRCPARMTVDHTRPEGLAYDVVRLRDPETRLGIAYCAERVISTEDGTPATSLEALLTANFHMGKPKAVYSQGEDRIFLFQWPECLIAVRCTDPGTAPASVKVSTLSIVFPSGFYESLGEIIREVLSSYTSQK